MTMTPETLTEPKGVDAEYKRIEAEIASDASPVGIDAKKTHVMILAKLESIERRLDRLERGGAAGELVENAKNALGAFTDTFDETVAHLAGRGVDVDSRRRAALTLLERTTDERALESLGRLADALAQASGRPSGSVGPLQALGRLRDEDAKRGTAFLIEVARALGAGLKESNGRASNG